MSIQETSLNLTEYTQVNINDSILNYTAQEPIDNNLSMLLWLAKCLQTDASVDYVDHVAKYWADCGYGDYN